MCSLKLAFSTREERDGFLIFLAAAACPFCVNYFSTHNHSKFNQYNVHDEINRQMTAQQLHNIFSVHALARMCICTGLSEGFAAPIHVYVLLSKLLQLMDNIVCMVIGDSFGIINF